MISDAPLTPGGLDTLDWIVLAAYLVADLVLSRDPPSEAPDVVFRPDYVERLVGEESD